MEQAKNIYYSCVVITRFYIKNGEVVEGRLTEIFSAYNDI